MQPFMIGCGAKTGCSFVSAAKKNHEIPCLMIVIVSEQLGASKTCFVSSVDEYFNLFESALCGCEGIQLNIWSETVTSKAVSCHTFK